MVGLFYKLNRGVRESDPQITKQTCSFARLHVVAEEKTAPYIPSTFRLVDVSYGGFKDHIAVPEQGPLVEVSKMKKIITSTPVDLARFCIGASE